MTGKDLTEKVKATASSVADSVNEKGVTQTLKEKGSEALAEARGVASRTADAARDEAMSRSESVKDGLAEQGDRLVQSLRSAHDGGDDSVQARVMGVVADTVEELTGSLRNRDVQSLLSDAQAFASRNPGAFVAAAALAGFALARFARSSTPEAGYDPSRPAVSQGYATMPPAGGGEGGGYGSPRATGSGYAASSVSTRGMTTHDDDAGASSVEAMPEDDMADEDAADRDSGFSTGTAPGSSYDRSQP